MLAGVSRYDYGSRLSVCYHFRYDHIFGLGIRVEDLLAVLLFTITVSGLGL